MENQNALLERLIYLLVNNFNLKQLAECMEKMSTDTPIPIPPLLPTASPPVMKKLQWMGNLKNFAELFIVLEDKGWIAPVSHGELRTHVHSIMECFDFSRTQKRKDSNTGNCLTQYLKPSERADKVFSKRYVQCFSGILPNYTSK